jgi:TolB-like protein/DNA-binding winged helix-turn-helix (wHTH) protein/Tfp pilus assembly protein PilF
LVLFQGQQSEVKCRAAWGLILALGTVKSGELVRLGNELELDIGAYELRRSGRRLKLERIPMELLLLLVEHRGQLVSREQIVEKIWGKDVYLATDGSINAAIRKVRHALKDDPDQPRFVQTISGKGYRFIAPVLEPETPLEEQATTAAATHLISRPASDRSIWHRLSGWRGPVVVGIIALLAAAFSLYGVRSGSRTSTPPPAGRFMLAVLPFDNLTGDAGQDYFSDGLTEEMISQLGNIDPQHLGVIARTSVMYYKNRPQPLQQIGRDLGVQYVLEGSVRRDSGKVRITAQLIQVKDQSHLWARQYDRELSDLLSLQGEIAHQIAVEIRLTLGHSQGLENLASRPAPVAQPYEAYDLYLKGQYFWNKRTSQSFQQAIDYFQQAIAKDPTYARAYAGLADSYALISGYNTSVAPKAVMPKARAAALRAIELDDSSAEAHTSLAVIAQNYDWDWSTAEREYRRAIQLNPNYATAHHWFGEFLGLQGRFDESFREFERARQLDPLSLIIAADHGAVLYYARQYDGAIAQFRAVLEMEPNFPRAYNVLGPYAEKGMYADAAAQMDKWGKTPGDRSWLLAWRVYFYGRSGDQSRARHALGQLKQLNQRQTLDPTPLVVANIGLGDKKEALLWLERACADRSTALTGIKVNPVFDPLRSEPRFQELLRRMGLAN